MDLGFKRLCAIAAGCCVAIAFAQDGADRYGARHLEGQGRELAASSAEVSVTVLASEDRWFHTGVRLRQGATYRITATGEWSWGFACANSGPSGAGSGCLITFTMVPGLPIGMLLGKVGREGAAFPVGDQREFTAQADGDLYLRHNDAVGFAFDNNGFANVRIQLASAAPAATRAERVPAPAPGAAPPSAPAAPAASTPSPRAEPVPAQPAQAPVASQSTQHWAVVVGVSEYADTRIPSLRYANADARAIHQWLVSPDGGRYASSRVRLLLDRDATAAKLRDALFNWLRQAIEEDVVLIYFAGHGSPDSADTPNNLYLLPHDTDYGSIASTGFPMWDIETALKRFIKAKRVVVIADACHSGGVGQGFDVARRSVGSAPANPISSGLQGLASIGPGVVVLSASDDKQFSAEGAMFGGGHGAFTHFLLEGLRGQADYNQDRRVTLGELIPYLSENVRRATRNAQSPTVAGRFDPALAIGR